MQSYRLVLQSVCSFKTLLLVLYVLEGSLNLASAQSERLDSAGRIENRIPRELLAQPAISAEVERLRALRKSAARYGKKHPAYGSTEKQIAEVEVKLRSYLEEPQRTDDARVEIPSADPQEHPGDRSSRQKPSAQGLDSADDFSNIDFATGARLVPAYRSLKLPRLTGVGCFPALGLIWGGEYDSVTNASRIWQWSDLPDAKTKSLYYEAVGKIEALAFLREFQEQAFVYLLVNNQFDKDTSRITIEEIPVQAVPPFSILEPTIAKTLLDATVRKSPRMHLMSGEKPGILLGYFGDFLETKIHEDWQLKQTTLDSVWSFSRKNADLAQLDLDSVEGFLPGIARSNREGSIAIEAIFQSTYYGSVLSHTDKSQIIVNPEAGSILQAIQPGVNSKQTVNLVAKTSRGIQGCFLDTTSEPLILDGFGVLLAIEPKFDQENIQKNNEGYEVTSALPSQISRTGWFIDISKAEFTDAFISFVPGGRTKDAPHGVRIDRFLSVPNQKKVNVNSMDSSMSFPPGSLLLQNYIQIHQGSEMRILKTLGLVKTELDWVPFVYDWKYDQSDANLSDTEDVQPLFSSSRNEIEFIKTRTRVSSSDCLRCHRGPQSIGGLGIADAQVPLGHPADGSNIPLTELLKQQGKIHVQSDSGSDSKN
jgi:cell fate (sporulation/competence/biofilm development) regulator YmcA (YheA/YmcA/DUF963 family)